MLKKFVPIAVFAASMMFMSCSDDKKDDGPSTQTIPNEQQAEVTQQTTGQLTTMMGQVDQMGQAMTGQGIYKLDPGAVKTPPAGWEAVGDGWYRYTYYDTDPQYDGYTLKVRFTPDIWAMATPDYDAIQKYEYTYTYNLTEQYYTGYEFTWDLSWSAWAEWEDTGKTMITGSNTLDYLVNYNINYDGNVINYDWKYLWDMDYDGVSVNYDDKTAHFTFVCKWPFEMDEMTYEWTYTDLAGEFKFAANGAGNLGPDADQAGFMKSNGTIFAKFYHNGQTGWYTLANDGFTQTYTWYVK